MRKRFFTLKILLVLIMIFSLVVTPAFAEISLDTDIKDGKITVAGQSSYPNEPVSIKVTGDDLIQYLDTKTTSDDGQFEFGFTPRTEAAYSGKVNILGETKEFAVGKPQITGIKVTPDEIKKGEENVVAVGISTSMVQDGAVAIIDVVKEDGTTAVSEIPEKTATIQEGKAEVELKVPSGISEGKYKIRVSCQGLLSYGLLTISASGSPGSGGGGTPGDSKSVSVNIRVEGWARTIVPRTRVTVDNFDLTPYLGRASGTSAGPSSGWGPDKLKKPTVAHALVKALKNAGINCADHKGGLDLQDYGWSLYVSMIAGEREFDHRDTSGWMYRVDGWLPNYGCQEYVLDGGEDIVWFFGEYGFETWYTTLEADKTSAKTGEDITLTLTGEKTDLSAPSGSGPTHQKDIANAVIYVNGNEFRMAGSAVKTDADGKATIRFNEPGTYRVSAEKPDHRDIVRPLPVQITVTGEKIGTPIAGGAAGAADAISDLLTGDDTDEAQLAEAVWAASECLATDLEKLDSAEDAEKLLDNTVAVAEQLSAAASKITSPENAQKFMDACLKVTGVLAGVSEKIDGGDQKQELKETTVKMINAVGDVMDQVTDRGNLEEAACSIIEACAKIVAVLPEPSVQEVQKQVVEAVQKALSKIAVGTVVDDSIKLEDTGVIAAVDAAWTESIADKAAQAIKNIEQKLTQSGIAMNSALDKVLTIEIPSQDADSVEAVLPAGLLDTVYSRGINALTIKTGTTSFKLDSAALGENAKGKEISLTAARVEEIPGRAVPEGSMVVNLEAKADGQRITGFQNPVMVSIPYQGSSQRPGALTAFLLKDDGSIEPVGGVYDPKAGTVKFLATHFGKYFAKESVKQFDDIDGCKWAQEAVETLAGKGIISGKRDGVFDPAADITRAEFAALITEMLKNDSGEMTVPFKDVDNSKWYHGAVAAAYNAGLISGRSPSEFDPEGNITRQEITGIIAKVLEKKGYTKAKTSQLKNFKDSAEIASWAEDGVALVVREGIITGMGDGRFAPKDKATRAQAAVIISNLYRLVMR